MFYKPASRSGRGQGYPAPNSEGSRTRTPPKRGLMRFARITLLISLVALVVVPAALAIRFTDDSYNMPPGVVGQSYSKQFNGAGGCGPALPYQYSLIGGTLPAGLSLSSSGLISGPPTRAGHSSLWATPTAPSP